MSKLDISETQFAFAFFHKLMSLENYTNVTFCFPSTRQEGNEEYEYAGADLVVNTNLFFQFKMPVFFRKGSTKEIRLDQLTRDFFPYYRFNIKNSKPSQQFNLLKKAAKNSRNLVSYILPMYIDTSHTNFEKAFLDFFRMTPKTFLNHICCVPFNQFVRPIEIELASVNTHKICYSTESVSNDFGLMFSKKEKITANKGLPFYDNDGLKFSNSKDSSYTLEKAAREVQNTFFSKALFNNTSKRSFIELQSELIASHNIFWIPVIHG